MKEERRADKRTEDERERSKHCLLASLCDPDQTRTQSREARESGTSASAHQGPFGLVLRDQRWQLPSWLYRGCPKVPFFLWRSRESITIMISSSWSLPSLGRRKAGNSPRPCHLSVPPPASRDTCSAASDSNTL